MGSSNYVRISYAKEASYGVTPTSTASSLIVQDLTYTADQVGTGGQAISIQYQPGGTAGSEVVSVSGKAILVTIASGTSTASQIKTRIEANAAAAALVDITISGVGSNAQTTYAATNLTGGTGGFQAVRFTSESYSGSPTTVESAQIRTDRLSSGQVVTGLTVGGQHSFELAKETGLDAFMESALLNTWDVKSLQTRGLTIDAVGKTITATTGSFVSDGITVGDFITLGGFTSAANNVQVMVTSVTALVLGFVGPTGMVSGTGGATTYKRLDKLTIGTTIKSLSMEKKFLDLTDKAINYKGMIASDFELNVEYGQLITGSFTFSGNSYKAVSAASDALTYNTSVADAGTTSTLNGSVDMPFLATNVDGTFSAGNLCLQSLSMTLANNLTAQNCIGNIAPESYSPGNAAITVSLSSYLKDANWSLLQRKLTQDPFSLGFLVKNSGGGYAFYMPAVQASFDDPSSGGANQVVSLDLSGTAKVGANGESSLSVYRI